MAKIAPMVKAISKYPAGWIVPVAAVAGVGLLWHTRAGEIGDALRVVSRPALAVCVLLHLVTLVARSEAWRLSLAAIDGRRLSRLVVHNANAGAFCCGALIAHAGMPARIGLLRRLAGDAAPRVGQIVVADAPIFVLEVCATCALLSLAGGIWTLPLALLLVAAARFGHARFPHRPAAHGLAVLAQRRRATGLAAWIGLITLAGAVRVWLVLAVLHLPSGVAATATAFAALGVFGLLPLGPGAPAAATVASFSGHDVDQRLAAGIVIAGSTLLAVAIYGIAVLSVRIVLCAGRRELRSAPAVA